MKKKVFVSAGIIIVVVVTYWLVSPLFRNLTLNEQLPGTADSPIKDNLSVMDADTKADFERQTMEMKDKIMEKDDGMPVHEPLVIGRADMIARAHAVEGEALLVQSGDETFLRFENLKTINGPDLRIYLSADLSADDFLDLGPIRATEGNVNYPIPVGTDLAKYKNAMVWCRAFGVLFSYAQL